MRSIGWSADDTRLVSAGMDGAVYEWALAGFRRERESVIKVGMIQGCHARLFQVIKCMRWFVYDLAQKQSVGSIIFQVCQLSGCPALCCKCYVDARMKMALDSNDKMTCLEQ